MKTDFPHASQTFRKLNPHLYGSVGAVEAQKPEPDQGRGRQDSQLETGAPSVAIRVSLVVLQRRTLDSDNLIAALKAIRDAIAESLGIDDGDERITFEYGQQRSEGQEGVIVKIELIDSI